MNIIQPMQVVVDYKYVNLMMVLIHILGQGKRHKKFAINSINNITLNCI